MIELCLSDVLCIYIYKFGVGENFSAMQTWSILKWWLKKWVCYV